MAVTGVRQGETGAACDHVAGIRHYRTRLPPHVDRLRMTLVKPLIQFIDLLRRQRVNSALDFLD